MKTLNAGGVFGFLGCSDSHRFLPGLSGALTGVYAEDLTHDSLMDALRRRRCFATTGQKTALDFRVGGIFMGSEGSVHNAPKVRWRIHPFGKLESATILRDGCGVYKTRSESGVWLDDDAAPGRHWYVLEVKEYGQQRRYPHNVAAAWGKYAWSSPACVTIH